MNQIKAILKEKGITINELADKLGVSRVTLSSQINGKANLASYEKIASALGVSLWELFAPKEEFQPKKDGLNITCPHCGKDIY